jgi:hypothetical protein
MCGKPIFGVDSLEDDYNAMFYCSKDCELAHLFYCLVCLSILSFIPGGWLVVFLINGVPMSMQLLVIGLLALFMALSLTTVYITISSWNIRRQIIRNRLLDSIEADLEE